MRKLLLVFALLATGVAAWPQTPTPTVNVGTTDPLQIQRWVTEAAEEVRRLNELVRQVQLMNEMVQAQVRVIEDLSEGDWEGILDAYQEQANALYAFNDVMLGMDETFANLNMDELAGSESLSAMQDGIGEFTTAYASTADVLGEARRLGRNAVWRADRMAELQVMSAADPGLARQLQIENSQLSLLSGQLGEIQYVLSAIAAADEIEIRQDQAAQEITEQRREDFWENNLDETLYERSYDDDDFEDTVLGGDLVEEGLGARRGF